MAAVLAVHAMVFTVSREAPLTDAEKLLIERILIHTFGIDYPRDDDVTLAKFARNPPDRSESFLESQRPLSRAAKEAIFRTAALASFLAGTFFDGGAERLASVGTALGMSWQAEKTIVEEVTQGVLEKADRLSGT